MRKKLISFLIIAILLIGLVVPVSAAANPETGWETAMNRALDRIRDSIVPNPIVDSVGGEWAVLAMARAGRVSADDPWVQGWLSELDRLLAEVDRIAAQGHDMQNPPSAGTFPAALRRWTDFQRVTIALSALGIDASNYNGRDLTQIYSTFVPPGERHALNQTINVDIFALIALDTKQYTGDRELFIQSILDAQRPNGSWGLGTAQVAGWADLDVTAMAIQSLARHVDADADVKAAVDRALTWARAQTFPDPEGKSQMIVALTALGSEFADEASYYVNRLLSYFDTASGGFRRTASAGPVNHMSTEQAAYALVAYWRLRNDMTALYDMSDVAEWHAEPGTPGETVGLPGRHAEVRKIDITSPGRTFADVQNHANRPAIEALAARGIINGRSETVFAPDETMTRAEFAAIITRGLGLPERAVSVFTDVQQDAWFAISVGTAFYFEIVTGTSATTFNPNGTITRQEAAVMVARAARLTGLDTALNDAAVLNILAAFGDSRAAADWARAALAFCFHSGILDDTEFYIEPQTAILRGEIAEMLYRLLGKANLL